MTKQNDLAAKAEHYLDRALAAAVEGRIVATALLAATAAKHFHDADTVISTGRPAPKAEQFFHDALRAAANGQMAASAELAERAARHFYRGE